MALSALTEGRAVNVVAAGLSDGYVSLWDTWLLRPVGEPLPPTDAAAGRPVTRSDPPPSHSPTSLLLLSPDTASLGWFGKSSVLFRVNERIRTGPDHEL